MLKVETGGDKMFETGGKSPAEWMNEGMMARLGSGMREGMPLVQIDEEEDEPVEIVRSTNINLAYRAPEDTEDDDDEVEDCVDDVRWKAIPKKNKRKRRRKETKSSG